MMPKLIFAGLLACSAFANAATADISASLRGHWMVSGSADAQETTSLSSDDIDKLVGSEIIFMPDRVQFSTESCEKPTFKRTRHSTNDFFRREYKMDPAQLRLPAMVTEVAINCKAPSPINFVYIRDKRHILFYWKGFFLNAEKRSNATS